MSSGFYWGSIVFFTTLFTVFFAVTWSVLRGVRDNYYRHYQKAELQWTGQRAAPPARTLRWWKLVPIAFLAAWLVVEWILG